MVVPIQVRLPDDLHRFITTAATEDERSINGEIVWFLREAQARRRRSRKPKHVTEPEETPNQ